MNIAVSDCLLGTKCRFDASCKTIPGFVEALRGHTVVPVCPERAGGLPCPRPPSEIDTIHGGDRVFTAEGVEVTDCFLKGARLSVERALEAGCTLAVLKSKSPSCGVGKVYDGTFSGSLVPGFGIAARAFRAACIHVIDEEEFMRRACSSQFLCDEAACLFPERV